MALAVGLSPALANGWLNTLRNVAYQKAAIYAQIHTAIPGAAGTASVAANDTTRKLVGFSAAASGVLSKDGTEVKWTSTQDFSEAVSHISMWDASTAGNFQWSFAATASKTWTTTGDTLTLASCDLSLTPIATT